MSRYTNWLKRKENATPYANEAVCMKCKYGEWVRTAAFCKALGKPRRIPQKAWFSEKPSHCPEYFPKEKQHMTRLEFCQYCGQAVKWDA